MFFAKTDQVTSPFELEVDMVYVTPSPGTGWRQMFWLIGPTPKAKPARLTARALTLLQSEF